MEFFFLALTCVLSRIVCISEAVHLFKTSWGLNTGTHTSIIAIKYGLDFFCHGTLLSKGPVPRTSFDKYPQILTSAQILPPGIIKRWLNWSSQLPSPSPNIYKKRRLETGGEFDVGGQF